MPGMLVRTFFFGCDGVKLFFSGATWRVVVITKGYVMWCSSADSFGDDHFAAFGELDARIRLPRLVHSTGNTVIL